MIEKVMDNKIFHQNTKKLKDLIKTLSINKEDFILFSNMFKGLDLDGNGKIHVSELYSFKELKDNALFSRVINCLNENKDGVVDFSEFCQELSIFAKSSSSDAKIKLLFNICDEDKDTYLNKKEISGMCSLIFPDILTDKQIDDLSTGVIGRFDDDWDDKLSFEEFQNAISSLNVDSLLSASEDPIDKSSKEFNAENQE